MVGGATQVHHVRHPHTPDQGGLTGSAACNGRAAASAPTPARDAPDETAALARAAMSGDRAALERLWAGHRRWVAAVLLAHRPRGIEVDDLLQEVAWTVVRRIQTLREPETFRPWLRTIAVNAARAAARRANSVPIRAESTPDQGSELAQAGVAADRRDEGRRLLELAGRLPEAYREPLLMRCVQGMSHREIGAALGLPVSTIETRIARGRRRLRELAAADEATRAHEPQEAEVER